MDCFYVVDGMLNVAFPLQHQHLLGTVGDYFKMHYELCFTVMQTRNYSIGYRQNLNLEGGGTGPLPPPLDPPLMTVIMTKHAKKAEVTEGWILKMLSRHQNKSDLSLKRKRKPLS